MDSNTDNNLGVIPDSLSTCHSQCLLKVGKVVFTSQNSKHAKGCFVTEKDAFSRKAKASAVLRPFCAPNCAICTKQGKCCPISKASAEEASLTMHFFNA
eukprot:3535209-Amphidinium_carterae.1